MAYGNEPGDDLEPTPQQIANHNAKTLNARKVPCRYCGAKQNEPCRNKITGHLIKNPRAHPSRIIDAETIVPLHAITDEDAEELF